MRDVKTFVLGRGHVGVMVDGRDAGEVRHNVVTSGAIKWSAYDQLGQRIDGTYLTEGDAVNAVVACA